MNRFIAIIFLSASAIYATPDDDLLQAASKGDLPALEKALSRGAKVNTKSGDGGTAVIEAVSRNHIEILKRLIKAKANVNATNRIGVSALMLAAAVNRTEMMTVLIKAGAKTNATTVEEKLTALFYAIEQGNIEAVKLLLAAKAKVNIKTTSGDTPLSIAEAQGHTMEAKGYIEAAKVYKEIIDLLKEAGAK